MRRFAEHEVEADQKPAGPLVDEDEQATIEAADQASAQQTAHTRIQMRFGGGGPAASTAEVHEAAADGTREAPTSLPHADRIQASFGRHDVSGVKAHVGGRAAEASDDMGASAFATGSSVGFAEQPDLHTAAHEAAHVVQQRGGVQLEGGVGESGDEYEQNADAVADKVVEGESAEGLLDSVARSGSGSPSTSVVQRDPPQGRRVPRPPPRNRRVNAPNEQARRRKRAPQRPRQVNAPNEQARRRKRAPRRPRQVNAPNEQARRRKRAPRRPRQVNAPNEQARRRIRAPQIPQQRVVPQQQQLTEEIQIDDSTREAESTEIEANAKAKENIETGTRALDFVLGKLEAEKAKRGEPDLDEDSDGDEESVLDEQEETDQPQTAQTGGGGILGGFKRFFKGLRNLFTSKSESSSEDELPLPAYAYNRAIQKIEDLKDKLATRITNLEEADTDIATQQLDGAKQEVDTVAEECRVAPNHKRWLKDIGEGIRHGTDRMAKNVIARTDGAEYDEFETRGRIGKGGSGALVFRTDYLGVAPMAYKLGKSEYIMTSNTGSAETDTPEEMLRENAVMRDFSNENVLGSGGIVRRDGNPGVLMELAANGDLESVKKKMRLSLDRNQRVLVTRYLIRGALRGLQQLHEHDKNYVHADIKDQNFLLGEDMQPKLMDFGTTRTGGVGPGPRTGTPEFMAPEVNTQAPGQKSDIWSMGEMVLQFILDTDSVQIQEDNDNIASFGKEQYRTGMTDQTWHHKFRAKTVGLQQKTNLDAFVQWLMHRDPGARPTAAAALGHAFLDLGDQEAEAMRLLEEDVLPTQLPDD